VGRPSKWISTGVTVHSGEEFLYVLQGAQEGTAEHCGIDVASMQAEYMFDWAARVLGGVRS
jgi:hypothetical protein